jgi:small subunit ribosomal protein S21
VDRPARFCYLPALRPEGPGPPGHYVFARSPPPPPNPAGAGKGAGQLETAGERPLVQIFVRDNNVDQALKALKKKMQREGSFREMKRHVHYEKPSEKRARQKAEAVRRARKLARKRAQREGLIAAPKKPGR